MKQPTLPAALCVLGSTGSVGVQTLDVARACRIPVVMLSGGQNAALMERQAREFLPPLVVMADERAAADLAVRLADTSVSVRGGSEAVCEGVAACGADTVLNAILGQAGLLPTLAAVRSAGRLALANKESLVIAGAIVRAECARTGCELLPVDSEHSAIRQCLAASPDAEVRRLLLTASGGPFFGYTPERLRSVTVEETLGHPTWKMGAKITVDSATMMNKGFEVIEAVHLFGVPEDRIDVLIHRESIIHSAVEYIDRAVIAQLALPDMRTCIAYALTAPGRVDAGVGALDLARVGRLT
ncbi:MAG: 1-deoxy-D-xylulose-5-phosphate reductoisomerase, partial [Clostridia bacterium]|nr:1-deoxy-D-xylulose-5-phosphate reductoisomerase [Clostridia bacterium]